MSERDDGDEALFLFFVVVVDRDGILSVGFRFRPLVFQTKVSSVTRSTPWKVREIESENRGDGTASVAQVDQFSSSQETNEVKKKRRTTMAQKKFRGFPFPFSPPPSMPLDLELTRLASSPPPPAALRAGAAVSVDISSGRVSLGGVAFATLSAEDVAKVSSSSSSFSNPSQATVRTIRREKNSISSLTIRLVEPSTQQARPQYQQHPRRGEGGLVFAFFFFSLSRFFAIDRSPAFCSSCSSSSL